MIVIRDWLLTDTIIYYIGSQSIVIWYLKDKINRSSLAEKSGLFSNGVRVYCLMLPPLARPQFLPMFWATC